MASSLRGDRVGHGKLSATFGDGPERPSERLRGGRHPRRRSPGRPSRRPAAWLVGEIADLSIVSPSTHAGPHQQLQAGHRRGHRRATGSSAAAKASPRSRSPRAAAVAPSRSASPRPSSNRSPSIRAAWWWRWTTRPIPASSPASRATRRAAEVELAPDLLACDKAPSPRYADFNARRLELRGIMPTDKSSPQTLAMRFAALAAKAPVEVVVAPLRLELTPAGPGGPAPGANDAAARLGPLQRRPRLVAVPGERLKWQTDKAAKPAPGLELRGDKVAALKAGGGPLPVSATYFGTQSNAVVFKSVEADPNLTLRLDVDRTIRLAGEPGQLALAATCPRGDVELVPEMAAFASADAGVVKVDAKHGDFHAGAPGETTVTGSHAAAKQPATVKLHVYDPAKARLVFDPAAARLAVHEQAALPLFLEVQDGGKTQRAAMEGPGIAYAIAQPDAVRWSPPLLTGPASRQALSPDRRLCPLFEEHGDGPGRGRGGGRSGRPCASSPPTASLAPGQSVSLAVQQQLPGSEQWKEVRPDAVSWTVPAEAIWEPASRVVAAGPDRSARMPRARSSCGRSSPARRPWRTISVKHAGARRRRPGRPAGRRARTRRPVSARRQPAALHHHGRERTAARSRPPTSAGPAISRTST